MVKFGRKENGVYGYRKPAEPGTVRERKIRRNYTKQWKGRSTARFFSIFSQLMYYAKKLYERTPSAETTLASRRVVELKCNSTVQYLLQVPPQQRLIREGRSMDQIPLRKEYLLSAADADKKKAVLSLIDALNGEDTISAIKAFYDFRQAVFRKKMALQKPRVGLENLITEFDDTLKELTRAQDIKLEKKSPYIDKLKVSINQLLKSSLADDAGLHGSATVALVAGQWLLEAYSPDPELEEAGRKGEIPDEAVLKDCFFALSQIRTEFEDAVERYMKALLDHHQAGLKRSLIDLLEEAEKSIRLRGDKPTDALMLSILEGRLAEVEINGRFFSMGAEVSSLNLPALHRANQEHLRKLKAKGKNMLLAQATEKLIGKIARELGIDLNSTSEESS